MFQAGKAANSLKGMRGLKIDILGISERRWPGTGRCEIDDPPLFYSAENRKHHQNVVGTIVTKEIN